jgi:hypothetical protein
MSPEYTALAVIEDGLDKGSLQHCFLGIKRQQGFGIEGFRTVMPLLMDARAIAQEHTVGCRSVFIHDDETPVAMPGKKLTCGNVPCFGRDRIIKFGKKALCMTARLPTWVKA